MRRRASESPASPLGHRLPAESPQGRSHLGNWAGRVISAGKGPVRAEWVGAAWATK